MARRSLNGLRLPTYHRLDVRVTRAFVVGGGILEAYVDVFNVLNRENLRSYFFDVVAIRDGQAITNRVAGETLLPRLPSLGLRYVF